MLDDDKEEVINYGDVENEDDEQEIEEIPWNYQALRNAMSRGMSFWRSHTDGKNELIYRFSYQFFLIFLFVCCFISLYAHYYSIQIN